MNTKKNNRNRFIYAFSLIVVLILVSIIYASLAVNIGIKINKEKALNPDTSTPIDVVPIPEPEPTGTRKRRVIPTPTPIPEPDIPVIVPDDINWKIEFDNLVVKSGSVQAVTDAHILSSKTDIAYEIILTKPGQYYAFSVDIKNEGNLDAKVYESVKTGLSSMQTKYLTYDVTYNDGTPISVDDVLEAGTRKKINVIVKFNDDASEDDLPDYSETLKLTYKITYVEK
ncbi:MAG: hypothetical protein IKF36_01930 [Bacilli bacterium]|nr:hypothetical protein [Bacilli bacterium]